MQKHFCFMTILVFALILFTAKMAFSSPRPLDSRYRVVSSSNIDTLVCYMQTADNRILDLENLCRSASVKPVVTSRKVTSQSLPTRPIAIGEEEQQFLEQVQRKVIAKAKS